MKTSNLSVPLQTFQNLKKGIDNMLIVDIPEKNAQVNLNASSKTLSVIIKPYYVLEWELMEYA